MQRIEFISQLQLFHGLSDSELAMLSQSALEKILPAGKVLAGETDEIPELFLIREGSVKFTRFSSSGKEQTIQMFGPGDLVGLFSLFTAFTFPATVVALEDSRVLSFPRKNLEQTAHKCPALMVNLFYALAVRMNHCMCTVSILTINEISQRVARHLVAEARPVDGVPTVRLPYSHKEWALIMGTTPETLSRILTRYTTEGLICQSGRSITILDSARLEDV